MDKQYGQNRGNGHPVWTKSKCTYISLYACLNYGEAFAPDEIKKKSICINGDIGAILNQLQPTFLTTS